MPEYGFKCKDCKKGKYYSYKMSEVPKKRVCEKCGGEMVRSYNPQDYQVFVPVNFHEKSFNYDKRPSGKKPHHIKDNPLSK